MQPASVSVDESARLDALRALDVLDTEPEAAFDALVRVASMVTGTPISLLSLVDCERQWFKANVGLDGTNETPRDIAFCAHAILGKQIFEVPDATRDVRFADNPLVVASPAIRFYAGAPIALSDGYRVGTLCVIDRVARVLSDAQREILSNLAHVAAQALEGRRATGNTQTLSEKLAEQHQLLRVTLRSIGDGVITACPEGSVIWMNPVAERLTGWDRKTARGEPLRRIMGFDGQDPSAPARAPVERSSDREGAGGEVRRSSLTSKSGRTIDMESCRSPILNDAGTTIGQVVVFRDVTEQQRLSQALTYRATHDSLTGLANRCQFEGRLEHAHQAVKVGGKPGVLLFIDLDRFKVVNDNCGHAAGDRLLQQVAKTLRGSVRTSETIARLGGDEFGILLESCTIEAARQIGERLCDHMETFRFVHDDHRMRIGTSIGLVPIDHHWDTASEILKAGDAACYAAKQDGRNRLHVWFESDAAVHAISGEMHWASRIERALDSDRFTLYAQIIEPIAAVKSGLHAEVLLRMLDDDGSIIPPSAFLPAAERFQLTPRLDRLVLDRALAWLSRDPSSDAVARLSVNLSGQSLSDRAFCEWAVAKLSRVESHLRGRLCLEITETSAVMHLAEAAKFLSQLRTLGVRIALDDFGAGASSFGYLKTLAVDVLKIDGQFIRGLIDDPLNAAAVRCFVDVARVLGLETVAEFVENPAVYARLQEMGVDFAQGFLLHRPAPLDQLISP